MTSREAKRIALLNIIEGIRTDLINALPYWSIHPDTLQTIDKSDADQVAKCAGEILRVLERRASRLKSFGTAGRSS